MVYIVKEHAFIYEKLGIVVRFHVSSLINSSDEIFGCQSLRLSHFRLIEGEVLRFCHIKREEETSHNACRLNFIGRFGCVHVSTRVHRLLLIYVVIFLDEQLRLSHFKMIQ